MHRRLPVAFAGALALAAFTAPAARAQTAAPSSPAPSPPAPSSSLYQQIVDAMTKAFGAHPGYRANHAKGVVVEGHFVGNKAAAAYTTSPLFGGQTIPITVRFSDSTGVPAIPDGSDGANPHGLAIKYHLPNGAASDMVVNSLHFFPVSNGEDFRDLLLAVAASPPTAAHPTAIEQFFAAHPAAPKAFASAQTPDSFGDEQYYGVDAFIFVDKTGKRQPVRYIIEPVKVVHLNAADAAKQAPDFLMQEIVKRVAAHPVVFHLKAQLAGPGDSTSDATKPWPADRKVIDLGTITLDKTVADSDAAQKKLLFLPGNLTAGIERSDDPLIAVRNGSYAISFAHRISTPQ